MRTDWIRSQKRPKRTFFSTWVIFGVLGIAIVWFLFGDTMYLHLTGVLADADEDPVPVFEAKKESYLLSIPAHGEITGQSSVLISTPRTRARPLTIAWLIPEGSKVKAGDSLVRLDSTDAKLILERQQIVLASNKERLEILREEKKTEEKRYGIDIASAEIDFQYAQNIMPDDKMIFSKWDIMEGEKDLELAEETVKSLEREQQLQAQIAESDFRILMIEKKQAEEKIEIARNILDSMELVSPISGLVTYHRERGQQPQVGDQCWPGQELLEVINLEELQARFHVLERDAGVLEARMEAEIRLDAFPERRFKSTIKSVTPLAQSIERNSPLLYFTCDASLDMTAEDLQDIRPGMLLQAEIIKQKFDSCIVVPSSAVTTRGEEHLAYVQQGDAFLSRSIEIVPGSKGQTIILDGIREGEILALANPFETRKLSLPDFGKASSANSRDNRPPRRDARSRRR